MVFSCLVKRTSALRSFTYRPERRRRQMDERNDRESHTRKRRDTRQHYPSFLTSVNKSRTKGCLSKKIGQKKRSSWYRSNHSIGKCDFKRSYCSFEIYTHPPTQPSLTIIRWIPFVCHYGMRIPPYGDFISKLFPLATIDSPRLARCSLL